jgi:glycosyltransferase involved in cell wall biosynthesis
MDEVWPRIVAAMPDAAMTVVGRKPPADLVERARSRGLRWTFTGRVDDIRPHVRSAAAYVIPLRVGGGTRIKAFEAMAMGVPVVSTSIGIEGLELEAGHHFLQADSAEALARELVRLLTDEALGRTLARTARAHVESKFSNAAVARVFEQICGDTLAACRPLRVAGSGGAAGVTSRLEATSR